MFDWITDLLSSLAQWAYWTAKENGPAVGRRSRRAWRGLAALGRLQLWIAVTLLAGLGLWWTSAT